MNDVFQQFLALVDRDNQYKELTNQLKNQNLLIENLKKQGDAKRKERQDSKSASSPNFTISTTSSS